MSLFQLLCERKTSLNLRIWWKIWLWLLNAKLLDAVSTAEDGYQSVCQSHFPSKLQPRGNLGQLFPTGLLQSSLLSNARPGLALQGVLGCISSSSITCGIRDSSSSTYSVYVFRGWGPSDFSSPRDPWAGILIIALASSFRKGRLQPNQPNRTDSTLPVLCYGIKMLQITLFMR